MPNHFIHQREPPLGVKGLILSHVHVYNKCTSLLNYLWRKYLFIFFCWEFGGSVHLCMYNVYCIHIIIYKHTISYLITFFILLTCLFCILVQRTPKQSRTTCNHRNRKPCNSFSWLTWLEAWITGACILWLKTIIMLCNMATIPQLKNWPRYAALVYTELLWYWTR